MNVGGDDQLMSEINVTPFVDVMLVLLIIFMVTAPMMVQGIDVSLPQAESGTLSAEQQQIMITIDRENRVYVNDVQVTLEELGEKLERMRFDEAGEKAAFLRSDKSVPYGMVVNVMTVVKSAGYTKLGVVTESPAED